MSSAFKTADLGYVLSCNTVVSFDHGFSSN